MGCNSKHNQDAIKKNNQNFAELRELFIKRMTVDSEHHDRRRKDFNQTIFHYNDDGSTSEVWCETDMDMVLQCFDDAVKDWLESWCDVENCMSK